MPIYAYNKIIITLIILILLHFVLILAYFFVLDFAEG